MFNHCPSCKASVLDDDAEDCPFCGSPMDPAKAKGFQPAEAKKKSAEKPTASRSRSSGSSSSSTKKQRRSTSSQTAKKKSSAKSARSSQKSGGKTSDDPFAVDPSSMSNVTPLATKRTTKRPHKIVCPMCETTGYAPTAASGKDVRCPNSKCMVPVFTAPDFAAPKREEIETPSSKGTVLTLVGIAIAVFGAFFAYWWIVVRVPETVETTSAIQNSPPDAPGEETPDEPAPDSSQVAEAPAAPGEVRARAFERWPRAIETVADIQRRPVRLGLAAESYAVAGNLKQAQEYLADIPDEDRFYRIGPLAEIIWARLESGDEAAARETFPKLADLRQAIPGQGFEPARAVILWAAAAARFGDSSSAHEIAATRRDDSSGERLLASLESAAALADYGLKADHRWRPILPSSAPKSRAVSLNLLRHGQSETARSWGESAATPVEKAEILGAWSEGVIDQSDAGAESIRGAAESLDPAVRLYVLSRAALRAAARDGTATAESLFADINSAAEGITTPEPLSAGTAGELFNIDLSETAIERLRAAALAEAAHVAATLENTESAQTLLWRAVDHLRAAAPPAADVAARRREFETQGLSGIRQTLGDELGLPGNEADDAATTYRGRLPHYQEAAETALAGQAEILARGIGWGLGESILAEIEGRASGMNGSRFLSGSAGGRILAAFEQAGESAHAATIRDAGVSDSDVPLDAGIELIVWSLVDQEKFAEAGAELVAGRWSRVPDGVRLDLGLRIVSGLAGAGRHEAIAQFLNPINVRRDREEIYRAWGARAAASNHGMGFLDQIEQSRLSITPLALSLRGLVSGLEALPATEP